ncbi:hypothetical protein AAFC00_001950 [Neodothiora populina]|uniref:DDHD domain-containing protein n=1 Tax=Neodothiora populina TaxID=2781224 RepID=A0ABR3PRP5_9PEZI
MSATNQYIRQVLHHHEAPPAANARFFYTSTLTIDDPLSPLPPPVSTGSAPTNQLPHPFSEYDNLALDKKWHELRREILKYNEERGEKNKADGTGPSHDDDDNNNNNNNKGKAKRRDLLSTGRPASRSDASSTNRTAAAALSSLYRAPEAAAATSKSWDNRNSFLDGPALPVDADLPNTTGRPFARAPSRRNTDFRRTTRPAPPHLVDSYNWDDKLQRTEETVSTQGPDARVAVGISRLHHVVMPNLQMEPIYWRPVNDTAPVMRATWFYRDTMLPVETKVANMLEAGYVELQPWTETWTDELNSAVEVGAAGEEKIVHRLWPGPTRSKDSVRPGTSSARNDMVEVLSTAAPELHKTPEKEQERVVEAACDIIDISTGADGPDNKASGPALYGYNGTVRSYPTAGVIYANATEAHIVKPNLQPSTYYGRRPLANYIRKGRKLGIPVVRGFDQAVWDKLYPPKKGAKMAKAREGVSSSQSGAPPHRRAKDDADLADSHRPQVTDLVFVIHGIGQKLSERMESFHFTHAINAFRREVNVELGTDSVKAQMRKNMGGIMVLPVNWRQSLSFEEGGYRDGPPDPTSNDFSLKDITPETLPSVRNIVSDVMLDIPYYLSHHQPRMIAAVIGEANRIYQLWCTNNPGFSTHGRVHIIAHSLGSVMAVDILSKQPTHIPASLQDPTQVDLDASGIIPHFIFKTSNLFLAGSPAGFFLLLKRASLLPRSGRHKAGTDDALFQPPVCGEEGTYGCLSVDNIYNIINPYDPVSYRLNAAVDATYAHVLKTAWIPSATSGWGSWFYGSAEDKAGDKTDLRKQLPRLPSNVELETHDFNREDVAEKRMLLLNDNGQIDFLLRYGGGPLEIQYLTMLGAHSSYWLLKDFVRMIVLECGRKLGRDGTLQGMRAAKKPLQSS